jgi:antitoxin component YwqK of YwqJK toxin-antitoxin module
LGKNATVSIEPTPIQSTPPEQEATKNCDFCGEKILAIAKKCRYCGSMLDGSHTANSQAGVKPPEDVMSPRKDNVVDNTLSYKVDCIINTLSYKVDYIMKEIIDAIMTVFKEIMEENKNIVIVFLIIISLILTWYVGVDEVVTMAIEERNGIVYTPNNNNPFTGKYVSLLYSNGQKQMEESFKDGKKDGLTTQWFENGQKKFEENYKDSKPDGLGTSWFENGQKQAEGNWKNGDQDGLSTVWFENGQKQAEVNHKDGKLDGLNKMWYENGQKKSETNVKDGELNGLTTQWYENGQKKSEVNIKDGLPIE